jgi:APA family basic amino acid/polyamine antiporter
MPDAPKPLGTWSGVGLVVSNMIGAGVFLSAGFMAQDLTAGEILVAWVVGAVLALSGARAYATAAELVPRSGGEYRYLSELLHPYFGCLAGWASLLVGFSAPVAVDALSAGNFATTLLPSLSPRAVGTALVVLMTVLHSLGLRSSKWTQNAVFAVNVTLVLGFILMGLLFGHNEWPTWVPPNPRTGFPWAPFMRSLFFIAFAFSGWNATTYAAEEFQNPSKDVPRAMLLGCALVAVAYLLVNWVFVANLTPAQARVVFDYEKTKVTLGHVIATSIAGPAGGRFMSTLAIVAFVSAMSAMTFVGPRLFASMAQDGFLPRVLRGKVGEPPVGSVVFQGVLALLILYTNTQEKLLQNAGAILTICSALVAVSLFRVRVDPRGRPLPPLISLVAAGIFVASTLWMLYFGFQGNTQLPIWVGAVVGASGVAYSLTPRRGSRG